MSSETFPLNKNVSEKKLSVVPYWFFIKFYILALFF